MELDVVGQGLKIYTRKFYSKRHGQENREIIFEPQNDQGKELLDSVFPPDCVPPSGVLRKEFLDKWGQPDSSLGFYVRIRPQTIKDMRVTTDGSVSEDNSED